MEVQWIDWFKGNKLQEDPMIFMPNMVSFSDFPLSQPIDPMNFMYPLG